MIHEFQVHVVHIRYDIDSEAASLVFKFLDETNPQFTVPREKEAIVCLSGPASAPVALTALEKGFQKVLLIRQRFMQKFKDDSFDQ